jgi:hypothetical protein
MRIRIASILLTVLALVTIEGAEAADIAGSYSGRYRCRQWNTVDLKIEEQGGGRISGLFAFRTPNGSGAYSMTGQYDDASGRFQLVPQRWVGTPPPNFGMVGMTGRFDPATKRLSGKMDNLFCFQFELAGEGGAPLPPLPAVASPALQEHATNPALGIEYWDATMSAAPGTPRESEPIDDVIDWLRKEKYSCLGSQQVRWDASGTRGTAGGSVDTRARFVIECNGDCRGLRYVPGTQAQIYHFDRTRPVPVMQMKGLWFGGTVIRWTFTRPPGGKPPEVYIHEWSATGFDSGPGCKAPKSGAETAGSSDDRTAPVDPRSRGRTAPGAANGPRPATK